MLTLWAGDRHWSWTAMRFQTGEGVAQLEALANSHASAAEDDVRRPTASDERGAAPSNLSTDANSATGLRRLSWVG